MAGAVIFIIFTPLILNSNVRIRIYLLPPLPPSASFGHDSMLKVSDALELKPPNFVIKLLSSLGGRANYDSHSVMPGDPIKTVLRDRLFEVSLSDSVVTERQIAKFMSDCILPLALQTRALIIISASNECSLASAAAKVLAPVQLRLGSSCPFTCLGFGHLMEFHRLATHHPESIAGQMARESVTWSARGAACHRVFKESYGDDLSSAECLDLNDACSAFVIFEGIDFESNCESSEGPHTFNNSFMEAMIRSVPTVCIVTQQPDWELYPLSQFVDLIERKVPVLFLDARERCPLLDPYTEHQKPLTDYAIKSRSTVEVLNIEELRGNDNVSTSPIDPQVINKVAEAARDVLKRGFDVLLNEGDGGGGVKDAWEASTIAFLHGMIVLATNSSGGGRLGRTQTGLYLHEAIESLRSDDRYGGNRPGDDAAAIAEALCSVVFKEYPIHTRDASIKMLANKIAEIKSSANPVPQRYLLEACETELAELESRRSVPEIEDPNTWLALHAILTSPCTFSESLYDLSGVSRVLGEIAQIDRLPSGNSLEGSLLLQMGWDCVDFFHFKADQYKVVAKALYVSMLVLGVAVVAVGVVRISYPDMLSSSSLSSWILSLSLLSTMVTSYVAYLNPGLRWQQLVSTICSSYSRRNIVN